MSSSCFQSYSSTCATPKVSAVSKSVIGSSRPRGRRLLKKMLTGARKTCRILVNGVRPKNALMMRVWTHHTTWWVFGPASANAKTAANAMPA